MQLVSTIGAHRFVRHDYRGKTKMYPTVLDTQTGQTPF